MTMRECCNIITGDVQNWIPDVDVYWFAEFDEEALFTFEDLKKHYDVVCVNNQIVKNNYRYQD